MLDDTTNVQERYSSELLTIDVATRRFFGSTVSPFSVRRWIAVGVGQPKIKLRAVRIGGRYFLRPSDVSDFLDAVADPELYRRRKRSERVARATARLQRAGA